MFVYNVTIKLAFQIEEAWLKWMKDEHLDEVLATKMFDRYSFYKLIDPADEEGATYVIQYYTSNEKRYQTYINQYAPGLREKGYAKFGDQFIAFRSILKEID